MIPLAEKYPNDRSLQRSLMLAYQKRAENFEDLKEPAKAVPLYDKALTSSDNASRADPLSVQSRRDVAMANKKLAQALDGAGKSRESLEKLTAALGIFKEMNSNDPANPETLYDVANARFSVGNTLLTMKDYAAALSAFQTADGEFRAVLEKNPDHIYAVRMSTYNLDGIAKCYEAMAARADQTQNLKKALEHYTAAFESFARLKAGGNLGEVDGPAVAELEAKIKILKAKI